MKSVGSSAYQKFRKTGQSGITASIKGEVDEKGFQKSKNID